jgi:hypothetical protein
MKPIESIQERNPRKIIQNIDGRQQEIKCVGSELLHPTFSLLPLSSSSASYLSSLAGQPASALPLSPPTLILAFVPP